MSLINTRLQALRAEAGIDKWETRASRWGAYDYFRRESERPGGIITDDLRTKARLSIGRDLQVPVIDYDSGVVVSNVTQPVLITGTPSTSQLYAITFVNYYFGFLIHPAAHMNNEISMQREFNTQIRKFAYEMMDKLDNASLSVLEAEKSQVLRDDLGGRYRFEGDTVIAPQSEKDYLFGDLDVLMSGNDIIGDYAIIGNGAAQSFVRRRLMEKGQYNTENKSYQYDNKEWFWTNNLTNAVTDEATGFMVPNGTVGMVQQFGADNLMGNSTHKHNWGIETLPYANLPMGTYQYDDAVNASALHGAASSHLTATKVEAYGFHTAIAFVQPYNSNPATKASPILKFAIDKDNVAN